MKNLVIITSVVNTPNVPLSYTNTRSVFNREERFNDTKKTFESIKKYIPNCEILLVECTDFNEMEKKYFYENSNYIINLWDNKDAHPYIFGLSKSHGEGTMTIEALRFIINNNIECDNIFKISGRYWIDETFNYNLFENTNIIFKKINNSFDNILTLLYKIPKKYCEQLLTFLNYNQKLMLECVGYEVIFSKFCSYNIKDIIFYDTLGVSGKVSVCGTKRQW